MADVSQTPDDQSVMAGKETIAKPIVIRKLDRLETTSRSSANGG
jgi:hypothetical protein